MNTFTTEGIVLKRINFGEADKIVTIYSKHFGKISCMAKGIRRMTSRKRGSLEIFNEIKFFAGRGKDLYLITETELINAHQSLRKDLKKIAVAYEFCEMVDKLTPDSHEQEDVFDLLSLYLDKLEVTVEDNLNRLTKEFAINLLKNLGFWPRDKALPENFRVSSFIEDIIERELKSKNFCRMI